MLDGMHPPVSGRDCNVCQKYQFDEETGAIRRQKYGRDAHGELLPVLRPPGNQPPCRVPAIGCANGTPENPRSLSAKNRRAYRHYLECKATGRWPKDGIVTRNAGIIEAALSRVEIIDRWLRTKHETRLEQILANLVKAKAM